MIGRGARTAYRRKTPKVDGDYATIPSRGAVLMCLESLARSVGFRNREEMRDAVLRSRGTTSMDAVLKSYYAELVRSPRLPMRGR